MAAEIDAIWPEVRHGLTDEQILDVYAPPPTPWLRMNFVASLDGAATRDHRSGGLGDAADRRVFALLRYWADVVLVGAGTVRTEGYAAMTLSHDAAAWRVRHGRAAQPALAVVTRTLDLDPASALFAEAPTPPILYTVSDAPTARRDALSRVATIVDAGRCRLDPARIRQHLQGIGHTRIHSEGGPTLFGSFLEAGAVDELCLTLAPSLEGGHAGRIAHGGREMAAGMTLAGILRSGSELLLRYTAASAGTRGGGG